MADIASLALENYRNLTGTRKRFEALPFDPVRSRLVALSESVRPGQRITQGYHQSGAFRTISRSGTSGFREVRIDPDEQANRPDRATQDAFMELSALFDAADDTVSLLGRGQNETSFLSEDIPGEGAIGSQSSSVGTQASEGATSLLRKDAQSQTSRRGRGLGGMADTGFASGGMYVALGSIIGSSISGAFGLGATAMRDNTEQAMQASHQSFTTQNEAVRQGYLQSNMNLHTANTITLQNNQTQNTMQIQDNSYNNWLSGYETVKGNQTAALAQAGLPSYLAYMPSGASMAAQPKTTQFTPGGSTYTSKIPGNPASVPYTGTPEQVAAGYGDVT